MSVGIFGSTDKSAETYLFCHGFPEGSWIWFPVIEQIFSKNKNIRLIAPDLRGYNKTDKMSDVQDYVWDNLVNDVVELINVLAFDAKVHLVGHDWGLISWGIANKSRQVDTLTVLNAPHPSVLIKMLGSDSKQQALSSYMRFFCTSGSTTALSFDNFLALREGYSTSVDKEWFQQLQPALLDSWSTPGTIDAALNWYRANINIGLFQSWSDALKKNTNIPRDLYLTKPTLAIWGMADGAFHNDLMLQLTPQWVPDFTVFKVQNASHQIAQEYPELVASKILSFNAP